MGYFIRLFLFFPPHLKSRKIFHFIICEYIWKGGKICQPHQEFEVQRAFENLNEALHLRKCVKKKK